MILFYSIFFGGERVVFMMATSPTSIFGDPYKTTFEYVFITIFFLILLTYAISAVIMTKHLIKYKTRGFSITNEGIENAFVFCFIFSAVAVASVKKIPWEAVEKISYRNDRLILEIDTTKVTAGPIAKFMLFGGGFNAPFVSPYIEYKDIACYEHRFSMKNE